MSESPPDKSMRERFDDALIATFKSLMTDGLTEDEIIDELRALCRYDLKRLAKRARAEFNNDRLY